VVSDITNQNLAILKEANRSTNKYANYLPVKDSSPLPKHFELYTICKFSFNSSQITSAHTACRFQRLLHYSTPITHVLPRLSNSRVDSYTRTSLPVMPLFMSSRVSQRVRRTRQNDEKTCRWHSHFKTKPKPQRPKSKIQSKTEIESQIENPNRRRREDRS